MANPAPAPSARALGSFARVSPRRVIQGTLYTVAVLLFCLWRPRRSW